MDMEKCGSLSRAARKHAADVIGRDCRSPEGKMYADTRAPSFVRMRKTDKAAGYISRQQANQMRIW